MKIYIEIYFLILIIQENKYGKRVGKYTKVKDSQLSELRDIFTKERDIISINHLKGKLYFYW